MILIVGGAVILALIAVLVLLGRPERPAPPELEGDWWPQFEREFRAYVQRTTRRARDRRPGVPNPKFQAR